MVDVCVCVCVLRLAGLQKIFDGDDACSSSTKLLFRYKSSFSMDGKQHENGGNEKNCPKHVLLLCKDLHVSSAFAISIITSFRPIRFDYTQRDVHCARCLVLTQLVLWRMFCVVVHHTQSHIVCASSLIQNVI